MVFQTFSLRSLVALHFGAFTLLRTLKSSEPTHNGPGRSRMKPNASLPAGVNRLANPLQACLVEDQQSGGTEVLFCRRCGAELGFLSRSCWPLGSQGLIRGESRQDQRGDSGPKVPGVGVSSLAASDYAALFKTLLLTSFFRALIHLCDYWVPDHVRSGCNIGRVNDGLGPSYVSSL